MIDVSALITTGLAFFAVVASPGPAILSLVTIAMNNGRKPSLVYGLGLSSGLIFWGLVAAGGMGALLQSSIYLLMTLRIFAGVYLLWLAYLSWEASVDKEDSLEGIVIHGRSSKSWFLKGLLLNASNPKALFAWMAVLSVGLDQHGDTVSLVATLVVCIAVGLSVNASFSLLFSVNGVMSWYKKFSHWIERMASAIFTLAGGAMIYSAIAEIN